jgi:hypothetical protein
MDRISSIPPCSIRVPDVEIERRENGFRSDGGDSRRSQGLHLPFVFHVVDLAILIRADLYQKASYILSQICSLAGSGSTACPVVRSSR